MADARPLLAFVALLIVALCLASARPGGRTDPLRVDGVDRMPDVGFGTCCRKAAKGQPLIDSTLHYLEAGGRLLDTAQLYGNHRDVGAAVGQFVRSSGVKRESLWITSKVRTLGKGGARTSAAAVAAVDESLDELGLAYLDLMLVHHPIDDPATAVAVWRGLLEAKAAGKLRHVGVSNHDRAQIEALERATGARPAVNQIEFHPWVPDSTVELARWCQRRGVAVTGYGSLGSSRARSDAQQGALAQMAAERGVSSAQLLLGWALEQGVAMIPGATSAEHIRANLRLARAPPPNRALAPPLAPPLQLGPAGRERLRREAMPPSWRRWAQLAGEKKPEKNATAHSAN